MKINFIITANSREDYWPHLFHILTKGYKKIEAVGVLAYNGSNAGFPCRIRTANLGHSEGDLDLTMKGYGFHARTNQITRFIKIGIDCWLLDEDKIIKIFNDMERWRCGYGGNHWHAETELALSTDVFFADTRFGNIFQFLKQGHGDFEWRAHVACEDGNIKRHMIPERIPVHPHNRAECAALKWAMHHHLGSNLTCVREWAPHLLDSGT